LIDGAIYRYIFLFSAATFSIIHRYYADKYYNTKKIFNHEKSSWFYRIFNKDGVKKRYEYFKMIKSDPSDTKRLNSFRVKANAASIFFNIFYYSLLVLLFLYFISLL